MSRIGILISSVFVLLWYGSSQAMPLPVYPVGDQEETPTESLPNGNGYRISQEFKADWEHTGVDLLNAPRGTPATSDDEVRAIFDGTVVLALPEEDSSGFGNVVIIGHFFPDGVFYSLYAHLERPSERRVCGSIETGDPIGTVGNTGNSPTPGVPLVPHLHLAIKTRSVLGCGYLDEECDSERQAGFDNYAPEGPLGFIARRRAATLGPTLTPSTKFAIGERVETTGDVNTRCFPNFEHAQTIRGVQVASSRGTIIDGPAFTDGFWWWKIDYDAGPDGWSAENFLRPVGSTSMPLAIVGGTYRDRGVGLIGTSFVFDPVTPAGTIPFIDIIGPTSWNRGNPFECFRYQPPGTAVNRSICWDVSIMPVTGNYAARGTVDAQELVCDFSIDSGSQLPAPEITALRIGAGQVTVDWTASASARSFLVRVNPIPFTGVTGEMVVSGDTRTASLTGLSLVAGAQYQAVVFAFSQDVMTPDPLNGPFNIGAHGVVFVAPLTNTIDIPVNNPSFEVLPAEGLPFIGYLGGTFSIAAIPGWVVTPGSDAGQFQPGANGGAYLNTLSSGPTVGYSNGGTIRQTVGATVQAGVTYTLRVDVGLRNDPCCQTLGTVQLLIGDTVIHANGSVPPQGFFTTHTVTYTGLPADVGKPITIQLSATSYQGDFDNVRLTAISP